MFNVFITHLELFGIGFSFGIIGPCFLACAPILVAYLVGSAKRPKEALADITMFFSGRLLAYAALGWLAGLSGGLIRRFVNTDQALFLMPLAGVITIILGVFVLFGRESDSPVCRFARNRFTGLGGIFVLGLAVGIAPCAPLSALLLQITLMSKNAFEGMHYALSFGAGTFFSGFIVVAGIAGILAWVPAKIFKSKTVNLIFRLVCGSLLVMLGVASVLKGRAW